MLCGFYGNCVSQVTTLSSGLCTCSLSSSSCCAAMTRALRSLSSATATWHGCPLTQSWCDHSSTTTPSTAYWTRHRYTHTHTHTHTYTQLNHHAIYGLLDKAQVHTHTHTHTHIHTTQPPRHLRPTGQGTGTLHTHTHTDSSHTTSSVAYWTKHRYTQIQTYEHTLSHTHTHTHTHIHIHTDTQTHRHTDTQTHRHTQGLQNRASGVSLQAALICSTSMYRQQSQKPHPPNFSPRPMNISLIMCQSLSTYLCSITLYYTTPTFRLRVTLTVAQEVQGRSVN